MRRTFCTALVFYLHLTQLLYMFSIISIQDKTFASFLLVKSNTKCIKKPPSNDKNCATFNKKTTLAEFHTKVVSVSHILLD